MSRGKPTEGSNMELSMKTVKKLSLISTVAFALFAFNACGDDNSTSSPAARLPTEVKDLKELDNHKCDMGIIGEKVFVESEDRLYECDGEVWFKSYDQTKPESSFSSPTTLTENLHESSSSVKSDSERDHNNDYSGSSETKPSGGSSVEVEEVMPAGYYKENCPAGISCKDATLSTDYLNQEMLAAGKYGEMLDTRDGQVYKTIKICDEDKANCQTWMAQNLNYAYKGMKFHEGTAYESDSTSWCFGHKVENCDKYGRLYIWSAVMDSVGQFSENANVKCGYHMFCNPNKPHRGICPKGWHVPTDGEFASLYTNIGNTATGTKLKSTSDWNNNGNGTDDYGFSLLPGGYMRSSQVEFLRTNIDANLWTATYVDGDDAKYQFFNNEHIYSQPYSSDKKFAYSLRCLKD